MKKLKEATETEKEAYYNDLTPDKAVKMKELEAELEAIENDMTEDERAAFDFKPKKELFVEKLTDEDKAVLKRLEDSTQTEKEAYYNELTPEV